MKQNIQKLLLRTAVLVPIILVPYLAYSASGNDEGTSLLGWLGMKGKNMNDVATEIATLHDDNEVRGLDFSPDGTQLAATGVIGQTINIWDWRNGRIVKTLIKPQDVVNATTTVPLRFSPDGHWLAACHGPQNLPTGGHTDSTIWDTQTWQIIHAVPDAVPGGCQGIAFTPDGKLFLRAVRRLPPGDSISFYRADAWQPVGGLDTWPFYPYTLAVSPDNKFVALGGQEIIPYKEGQPDKPIQLQILIVDINQRKVVRTIKDVLRGSELYQLVWHPDGVHIAAGTQLGDSGAVLDMVRIFDVRTGEQVAGEPATEGWIYAMRYSPNGQYLIESAIDKTIRIWDGQHQHLLQTIKGKATSLAISADSRYVAMGGDRKILVWELK